MTEPLRVFPADSRIDAILPDGTHHYWSTHCRHDPGDGSGHRACSATVIEGRQVGERVRLPRKPAQCKTCAAPCQCPCHKPAPEVSG